MELFFLKIHSVSKNIFRNTKINIFYLNRNIFFWQKPIDIFFIKSILILILYRQLYLYFFFKTKWKEIYIYINWEYPITFYFFLKKSCQEIEDFLVIIPIDFFKYINFMEI